MRPPAYRTVPFPEVPPPRFYDAVPLVNGLVRELVLLVAGDRLPVPARGRPGHPEGRPAQRLVPPERKLLGRKAVQKAVQGWCKIRCRPS